MRTTHITSPPQKDCRTDGQERTAKQHLLAPKSRQQNETHRGTAVPMKTARCLHSTSRLHATAYCPPRGTRRVHTIAYCPRIAQGDYIQQLTVTVMGAGGVHWTLLYCMSMRPPVMGAICKQGQLLFTLSDNLLCRSMPSPMEDLMLLHAVHATHDHCRLHIRLHSRLLLQRLDIAQCRSH